MYDCTRCTDCTRYTSSQAVEAGQNMLRSSASLESVHGCVQACVCGQERAVRDARPNVPGPFGRRSATRPHGSQSHAARDRTRLAIARGSKSHAPSARKRSQSHEGCGRTQPRKHADRSVMTTSPGCCGALRTRSASRSARSPRRAAWRETCGGVCYKNYPAHLRSEQVRHGKLRLLCHVFMSAVNVVVILHEL